MIRQAVLPSIIADWASHTEERMTKIIKKFVEEMESDENNIDIKEILSDSDIKIFEKWVQIFNSITPFTIKDGLKLIDSSIAMGKRDEIILISYIKFFEQKLKHLKDGAKSYGTLFGEHKVGGKDFKGTDHTPPDKGDMNYA